jgi:hypothetical protein
MGFTNVVVSLRAPRATVAIPNDRRWPFFARRALEFLSQTAGGARGTILPLASSGPHPAVIRLIRRYDPDHLLPLMASLTDLEEIHPGVTRLLHDGEQVSPEKRWDFIRRAEEHGPHLMPLLSEQHVTDAHGQLNTFVEDDGHPRVHAAHPLQTPDRLLGLAASPAGGAVNFQTGDPLLDLAIGLHRGIAAFPTEVRRLAQGDLTRFQVSSAIVPVARAVPAPKLPTSADATAIGLSEITMSFRRDRGPLVVLGRTADDFALALAWGHFAGPVVWLPLTRSQTTWLADLGAAVDMARRYGSEPMQVTSVSLANSRCGELMSALWAARLLRDVDDEPAPWVYVDPLALDPPARTDLRLEERWDQRFALPTSRDETGAQSMATRFPLTSPVDGSRHSQWIVDVVADRAPILSFAGFPSERLLAPEQDRWETFVRASGTGISFESGRWDFVAAGASPYGQIAQPQLRWPSLHEMLDRAASRTGNGVRTSAPGYLGRLAAGLFGGRLALTTNLHGPAREVLDQFLDTPKGNGPLTAGGIGLHSSVFVTFADLAQRVSVMNQDELRSWLDDQLKLGVIRVGHILDCEVCHWLDFYVLADVGSTFSCKRCAAANHLTVERWRMPIDGASWFYDLHPAVATFLRDHGDVPLLAVQALTRTGMRPVSTEFEFEIVAAHNDKPIAEIDFAFVSRDRLVIGEAKSNGTLDGRNRAERVRDARKLITAADILDATEICYASATTWSQSAWDAIRDAATASGTHVTIALAENVSTPTAATRTVLVNPTAAGE